MLYKKNLTASLALTIIWVEIKYNVLDTESITIITISNLMDSRSSTMKSTLTVSHYAFGMGRRYSSLIGRC